MYCVLYLFRPLCMAVFRSVVSSFGLYFVRSLLLHVCLCGVVVMCSLIVSVVRDA